MKQALLKLDRVNIRYGDIIALKDVCISVASGSCFVIIGDNGAGKSTLLRTILGLEEPSSGRIIFQGKDIKAMPTDQRVAAGIAMSMEGRQLFPDLTVEENLLAATQILPKTQVRAALDYAYELFPRLHERRQQQAGILSGGEQQMTALARALLQHPRLLLLDEPSLGLAPWLAQEILELVWELPTRGTTVLIAEQNTDVFPDLNMPACYLYRGQVIEIGPVKRIIELDTTEVQTKLQEISQISEERT